MTDTNQPIKCCTCGHAKESHYESSSVCMADNYCECDVFTPPATTVCPNCKSFDPNFRNRVSKRACQHSWHGTGDIAERDTNKRVMEALDRVEIDFPPAEPETFKGVVTESGGGMVHILVDRDTGYYPNEGEAVTVVRSQRLDRTKEDSNE